MKRKKNVFCSVLLALAMVMSLLPAAAVQAYAEEPLQQESGSESIDPAAVVAWADANDNGMIDEGEAAYASLSDALEQKESLLKLHTDYAESSQLYVNVDTVLDLNGHTLSTSEAFVAGETSDFFAFDDKTSHLTVKNGTIAASHNGDSVFWKSQNEMLTLDNVTVTASGELQYACIYAVDGTVILQNSRVDSIYAEGGSFELDGESAVTSWHITGGTFDVDPATLPGFDSDAYEAVWNEELQTWVVLQKSSDGNDCTHPNAEWNDDCEIDYSTHEVYCWDCEEWVSVPHVDEDEDDWCDICEGCTHPSAVWDGLTWDSYDHWMVCPVCDEAGWASHNDGDDDDTLCDGCRYDMSNACDHTNISYTYTAQGHQEVCGDCDAVIAQYEHVLEYIMTENGHIPDCVDGACTYEGFAEEPHYEDKDFADHRCDGCGQYWRGFCTPVSDTDHDCVNGENCGARLTDLCTDGDNDHICNGCNKWMDWKCEDKNDDHLCDGENCDVRLSDCADEDADGKCDTCGKGYAAVTAQYTAIAYEAEGEDAFASGTLQVTSSAAGTVTAAWGYGTPVTFTGELKADETADLRFEDVPLEKLDYVELTFTPDAEDVAAVTLDHYIEGDLVKLSVEALAGFDADTNGTPVAATFINGIPCMELYLFPGTAVTVQANLLPTDSWQVGKFKRVNYLPVGIVEGTEGKFYYEDADGEIIYAAVAIDSDDIISFTLPAEIGDRAWLDIFCTHGACVDSNQDHWCDSSICEDWMPGADANGDDHCDVCGQGMFLRSDSVEDCSLEQLLDSAADGDTIRLLADNNIAGDEAWNTAVWFNPEENITVTVDLNGFDFSVTESKYLLGIGNGTLKIIDSSEGKTGSLSNPEGRGILELYGGVFDLSEYHDPSGITVYNGQDVPAAISGYTGDPTPIRLILPEGYGATIEMGNKTFCTNKIPADFTAIVVELPQLALDGGSKTLKNAHLVAEKVLLVGYLNGQLKAVQAVETVTPEITITDEVLAYVTAQGGEVKVFLLNGDFAPNYRVLGSE